MQTHCKADEYRMETLDLDEMKTAAAVIYCTPYRCTMRYGEPVLVDDLSFGPDIHLGTHNGGYFVAHHAPGLPMNEQLHAAFVEVVRRGERKAAA